MKPLYIILILIICFLFTSCNRYVSPYEAANGKAKCGRGTK